MFGRSAFRPPGRRRRRQSMTGVGRDGRAASRAANRRPWNTRKPHVRGERAVQTGIPGWRRGPGPPQSRNVSASSIGRAVGVAHSVTRDRPATIRSRPGRRDDLRAMADAPPADKHRIASRRPDRATLLRKGMPTGPSPIIARESMRAPNLWTTAVGFIPSAGPSPKTGSSSDVLALRPARDRVRASH